MNLLFLRGRTSILLATSKFIVSADYLRLGILERSSMGVGGINQRIDTNTEQIHIKDEVD